MDFNPSLQKYLALLADRIVEDFGLAKRPAAERTELVDRIRWLVTKGAFAQALNLLSESDGAQAETIMGEAATADLERVWKTIAFVASRVPSFSRLMDQEYEVVKNLALESMDTHQDGLKRADEAAEAIGDLVGQAEDAAEDAHEIPGISVAGAGFDLLFDPARFRRTADERQRRLGKSIAVLSAKTLATGWGGLLIYTIADALSSHRIFGSAPEGLKSWVPAWYAGSSTARQLLVVVALGVAGALVFYVTLPVVRWLAFSPRITPMFEPRVRDDELLSLYMKPLIEAAGLAAMDVRSMHDLVYKSIYMRATKANREDLGFLEEILRRGDEKSAVGFLKPRVKGYREVMHEEAERFCRESGDLMASI